MKHTLIAFLLIVTLPVLGGEDEPVLVGHWTFDGANPLADRTGNFPDLVLQGSAAVSGGQLDVNGSGTTATGWAQTDSGNYSGSTLTSKTLVSFLTLQGLAASASAGSALTLNRVGEDYFDAIVFSEQQTDRWMAGSTVFQRSQPFSPGFQETATGQPVMMAITYESLAGNMMRITGYRNGQQIGQYSTANASTFAAATEVFFGLRHILPGGERRGALDALIGEACVFNGALSASAISQLMGDGGCAGTSSADLAVNVTSDPSFVAPGAPFTIRVTVTNNSGSSASDVAITTNLGSGVSTQSTAGCVEDPNGIPVCTIGTLGPGGTASVTIQARAPNGTATTGGTLSVSAATPDPDPSNNSASIPLTVATAVPALGPLSLAVLVIMIAAFARWRFLRIGPAAGR